uniref:Transducer of regulated CREB activity N-terminal domain-containing protein n=1 Tax=Meloidogyne incognita TaxID=6306 RepID=A0A914MHS5_MELIC
MSQATPRKFSEKIAILERKQNEEQEQFNNVMRDVRTITSNDVQQQRQTPQSSPQQLLNYGPQSNDSSSKLSPEGPHPLTTNWNRAGGSLPNVHQMVVQQPAMGSTPPSPYNCAVNNNYCWSPSWTNVQTAAAASNQFQQQQRAARTRSPGATHFHPYRNGTSPSGGHEAKMVESGGPGGVHLQPPDPTWSKTRSDPAIHTNTSATNPNLIDPNFLSYPFYSEVQNTWNNETPKMFNGPATAPPTAQIQPSVLFFPSYPLGQPNMPLNQTNNSINQHQNRQQQQPNLPPNQIFNIPASPATIPPLPSVSLTTQQIGSSPSCSSPIASCSSQQNFMINNNNGSPASQQIIFLQQLNNNNFVTKPKIGNNDQQQQLIMLENNRVGFQQQQQQLYNTKISPPPPYFSQNIITNNNNNNTLQQQLTTPLTNLLSQSRSAPTSPTTLSSSSSMENYHPLAAIPGGKMMQGQLNNNQWSQHRHFSASPDGMEVPNICVTGTDGSLDVDCFQDLQDLHLDSETLQMLKDQADHENMVDPACETQLLS